MQEQKIKLAPVASNLVVGLSFLYETKKSPIIFTEEMLRKIHNVTTASTQNPDTARNEARLINAIEQLKGQGLSENIGNGEWVLLPHTDKLFECVYTSQQYTERLKKAFPEFFPLEEKVEKRKTTAPIFWAVPAPINKKKKTAPAPTSPVDLPPLEIDQDALHLFPQLPWLGSQ